MAPSSKTAQNTFAQRVIRWQKRYGRNDFPWQRNTTLYRVWVSEIMLQQTQAKTVVPYYQAFIKRFPNLKQLASARIDEVLKLWTGLGYYSRAHSLHKAARIVRKEYAGRIPRDKDTLVSLPGIGESTAGAILSLACDQPHPILDANVARVLARHDAINGYRQERTTQKKLWVAAEHYLPGKDVAIYNQGMMDIGALICTATNPQCPQCPLRKTCRALAQNKVAQLPTKRPAKRRTQRAFSVVIIKHQDRILLEKRPAGGIWGGLFSFPESADVGKAKAWCAANFGTAIHWQEQELIRYNLSHIEMHITPLVVEMTQPALQAGEAHAYTWCRIDRLPGGTSSLVKRLLGTHGHTKD